MTTSATGRTATTEKIFETYSVSPQEAERIRDQFGEDEKELECLLGHKGAANAPSPNTTEIAESYVLFDI